MADFEKLYGGLKFGYLDALIVLLQYLTMCYILLLFNAVQPLMKNI